MKTLEREFREIEETLKEVKESSELMIDLAYTALLLNNKEIAEDVLELEERMDELHLNLEKMALKACSVARDPVSLLSVLRISSAAEELADAASRMAEVVLKGIETQPILSFVVEEAEETVVRARISEDSVMAGRSIADLDLEDRIGMRIIAVRRGSQWIYDPPDSLKLMPDDILIARGYSEGREMFLKIASGEVRTL